MSRLLIAEYLAEIDRLRAMSGSTTEGIISEAFKDLLKRWSRGQNLTFLAQAPYETGMKARVVPDGTILHAIRVPLGYWFRARYGAKAGVSKDTIFAYVYAALHDPVWRETYAINLRREFPRIPFHADFRQWADWGRRLLDLHIGYEAVEPWPLARSDVPDAKSRAAGMAPKPVLKSDRDAGALILDAETRLAGVPAEAWDYRLGNRSALDWVLDQHKEKTPRDPTIRARFDTWRFADHKERVADLLARVTRVSVETVAIVAAMRALPRPAPR